jgi:hypothetical protein
MALRWFPPTFLFPPESVRAVPLTLRGGSIGRWSAVAWDAQRYLPPFAQNFIDELVLYVARVEPLLNARRRFRGRKKQLGRTA